MIDLLRALYSTDQVRWLIVMILVNVGVAIVAAIIKGRFRLDKLGLWLKDLLLPYLVAYGAGAAVAVVQPDLAWIRDGGWVLLQAGLVAHLLTTLRVDLGVSLPEAISTKPEIKIF